MATIIDGEILDDGADPQPEDLEDELNLRDDLCPYCNGRGFILGEECEWCDGDGTY